MGKRHTLPLIGLLLAGSTVGAGGLAERVRENCKPPDLFGDRLCWTEVQEGRDDASAMIIEREGEEPSLSIRVYRDLSDSEIDVSYYDRKADGFSIGDSVQISLYTDDGFYTSVSIDYQSAKNLGLHMSAERLTPQPGGGLTPGPSVSRTFETAEAPFWLRKRAERDSEAILALGKSLYGSVTDSLTRGEMPDLSLEKLATEILSHRPLLEQAIAGERLPLSYLTRVAKAYEGQMLEMAAETAGAP